MIKNENYSSQEIDYLKENYGKIFAWKIAKKLNRSQGGLEYKSRKLGLKSNLGRTHFLGRKHTKLTLKIMSDIKLGNKNPFWHHHHTQKEIKNKSLISKKRWKNPEMRNEMIKKQKKAQKNPEYREKMRKSTKELWQKPEYRKKLSKSRKDMWQNPEYREKMSKTKKKLSKNLKFIRKRSKASKKMWQNPEYRDKVTKAIRIGIHQKPTLPEKQMLQIIKLNNLPFNYVGDGKAVFNGFCPDFLSKNPKHIIEVYGEYHHNLPKVLERDKRRKIAYNSLGYKLLVIWSLDIYKNPQRITERIVNFIENP